MRRPPVNLNYRVTRADAVTPPEPPSLPNGISGARRRRSGRPVGHSFAGGIGGARLLAGGASHRPVAFTSHESWPPGARLRARSRDDAPGMRPRAKAAARGRTAPATRRPRRCRRPSHGACNVLEENGFAHRLPALRGAHHQWLRTLPRQKF